MVAGPFFASGRRGKVALMGFWGSYAWRARPIWAGSPDEDASGSAPGRVSVATGCRTRYADTGWPGEERFGDAPARVSVATGCGKKCEELA